MKKLGIIILLILCYITLFGLTSLYLDENFMLGVWFSIVGLVFIAIILYLTNKIK